MTSGTRPSKGGRRGFVIGELLIALLLLAVAVSSLAALMYSVSRRPGSSAETECVASDAARGKCVPSKLTTDAASKLLRSGCATQSGSAQRTCKDTVQSADSPGQAIVRARTASASMALLAKKQRSRSERPNRGFIR